MIIKIFLAGDEAVARHTLLGDYLLLAQKLEILGFIYNNGRVLIIKSWDTGRS